MKAFIFLLIITFAGLTCAAQNITVSGRVIDSATAKPIPYVSILVANSTMGTKTDAEGKFTVSNLSKNTTLIASCLGYKARQETLSDGVIEPVLFILAEKSTRLKEVIIDGSAWQRNLDLFKGEFIGTTNPKEVEVINPDILNLSFDERANRLSANTEDFLEIQNNKLGYKLRFLIKDFSANFNTLKTHYAGQVVFEPLKGKPAEEKRWAKNRREAYNGSFTHFLVALSKNQLTKEKFVVYGMTRATNPDWKRDSARIENSRQQTAKNLQIHTMYLRGPQRYIETLIGKPLKDNDLILTSEQSDIFRLQFTGYIYVIYKGKTVTKDVDDLTRQAEAYFYQISALSIKNPAMPTIFNKDGQLLTRENLFFEGGWGSRIIDLLPSDYKPN